ncbi:MAG: hypothetical protein V4736_15070 [Bdellovibrionota bacterium]
MLKIVFVFLSVFISVNAIAKQSTEKRKPSSLESTIWETREIPVGKACPYQAQRYDEIAYQVAGDGGYVCYTCDYTEQSPMLVVTRQTKCNTTISCTKGKCE